MQTVHALCNRVFLKSTPWKRLNLKSILFSAAGVMNYFFSATEHLNYPMQIKRTPTQKGLHKFRLSLCSSFQIICAVIMAQQLIFPRIFITKLISDAKNALQNTFHILRFNRRFRLSARSDIQMRWGERQLAFSCWSRCLLCRGGVNQTNESERRRLCARGEHLMLPLYANEVRRCVRDYLN